MTTQKSILLRGGTVVIHGKDELAEVIEADILIRDNKIEKIARNIEPSSDTEVISCSNRIIAPGFIDTHRHMYTTGLKGRHGNNTLEEYLVQGIFQAASFDPYEVYWGQLAGCLESINAGTTTVVDHSHLNYSEDHPRAAIAATASSGIRSIYGYCFNARVDSWAPFKTNSSFIAPWALDNLKRICSYAPFNTSRITLGVAFDGWFLPKDTIVSLFNDIKDLGIRYLTTHNSPPRAGAQSAIAKMEECGLLTPWTILSHANSLSDQDIKLIKNRNAHISSTPSVELQMGMGIPACFDADRDLQSCSSLGIDCHNATLASLPAEMRMALQSSRGIHNDKFIRKGLKSARVYKTVQEVYALGTIAGARAIGMQDEIGSIAVGKLADIIVFDALTPNMICGAQQDPITAIVMHSTPADIVLTMVDGVIRKRDGQLEQVQPEGAPDSLFPISSPSLRWSEVAEKLLMSRATLKAKVDRIDIGEAKNGALKAFGYDPSKIVDSA